MFVIVTAALTTGFIGSGRPASASDEASSAAEMKSLDEQVQEIKSDALAIAAELSLLEEKLLYPSNTQIAIFVSLENGEAFRPDSIRIRIDGEPTASHTYSVKEIEALQKGGVQRIHTGNVATGEHQIDISVAGRSTSGSDVEATKQFTFRKEVEPKLVEIALTGGESGDALIQLRR